MRENRIRALAAAGLTLVLAGGAWGSELGQIQVVALPMEVPDVVSRSTDLGPCDPGRVLHIAVSLPYADPDGIQAFVDSVSDPASPSYRQFLTPEEVGDRFGLPDDQVQSVVNYLTSAGFQIDLVGKNHLSILADGTVAQAEAAFNTKIHEFQAHRADEPGNTRYFSCTTVPTLPATIAPYVIDVTGLENFTKPQHRILTPTQTRTLYGVAPMYSGGMQGQNRTVGISNWDGYRLTNVPLYYSQYSLPTPTGGVGSNITVITISGGAGSGSPGVEGDLDIQMPLGMAPLCSLRIYDGGNSDLIGVLTSEVNENLADTISESYGWNLGTSTATSAHNLHVSMSAQGITYMAASGDSGTTLEPYSYPDYEPEVLSVGGTVATVNGSGVRTSEVAWSSGGGGWSTKSISFNVLPSWQVGTNVPTTINKRLVPDVALHSGGSGGAYYFYYNGSLTSGYVGTSFASPVFAGALAVAEQQIISQGGLPPDGSGHRRFGRIQNLFYSQNGRSDVWYDVTSGSNGTLPNGSTSSAGTAWDFCTGWGAINFNAFAATQACSAPSITGQPGNQTACSGGSASFTVTATGATSYQWRKGTTNLTEGGNISGSTTATLTINPVGTGDAATNYNCVVTNSCGSATSNNASLTVNTLPATPTNPTATPPTICSGQSSVLSATVGGGETVDWFTGSCGGTAVTSPVSPTTTTTYYARARNTTTGCISTACASVTVTVNALPATPTSPTATPAAICAGQSSVLSATVGGGQTVDWFTGSCGGTAVTSPVSPTTTTTYYARARNTTTGCFSSACASVTVTVNALPATPTSPTATPPTICSGQSSVLSATVGGGQTVDWFTGSCGGTAVTSPVSPTTTTTYYARARNTTTGCVSTACASVTVTVNALPATPTSPLATPATICTGQSSILSATVGGGQTVDWSTGTCGGTAVTSPVSPTTTTIYYARARNTTTGCTSAACATVTVTVNALPATPTSPTATPATICTGQSSALSATVGGGETVDWFTGSCGGTAVPGGASPTVSPATTTTYYARARNTTTGCTSAACASVTVTVNALPVAPTSAASDRNNFCADDAGNISLSATGGSGTTLRWLTGSCTGTSIGTGNPLAIASPTATTTYYARWENTCGNSTCASVTVTVLALPVAPTSAASDRNNFCTDDAGNISLSATGGSGTTLRWLTGGCTGTSIGTGSPLVIASPTATTTYYARWENSCGNSTCASVTVTVNPLPDCTITPAPAQVCANSTGNTAAVSAGAATYAWGITNGTITAGGGTNQITYTAGATGSVHLTVTVTSAALCLCNNATDVPVVTCGATGACCSTSGTCAAMTSAACATAGGVYSGDGTVCRSGNLCPASCRGDMNCDGRVTFVDIDLFVAALAGESAWTGWPCPWLNADANGDLAVTFTDIDPFVALIGTTCP